MFRLDHHNGPYFFKIYPPVSVTHGGFIHLLYFDYLYNSLALLMNVFNFP